MSIDTRDADYNVYYKESGSWQLIWEEAGRETLIDQLVETWYRAPTSECLSVAKELEPSLLGGMLSEELTDAVESSILSIGFTDPATTADAIKEFLFEVLALKVENGITKDNRLGYGGELIMRKNE